MDVRATRERLDEVRRWACDHANGLTEGRDHALRERLWQLADAADDLAIMLERADAALTVNGG